MSEVLHIELASGLKLLCKANRANPTVSFQISVAAGAAADPRGKAGLAGFARALLTKGTAKHDAAWIAEKIDSLGIELGFSTGNHTTSLSVRALAENLRPALRLVRELLAEPAPPADEMERMRERILAAIKLREDNPAAVAVDRLHEMIYGRNHPYGRTARGTRRSVARIGLDDITAFYRERLLPGAAVGAVVGDVDLDAVEDLAAATLGRWRGGGEFALKAPRTVAPPEKPVEKRIGMPEKTQSDIALGFQGIRRLDPDYYALQVGNSVLGRLSLGGRIGQWVRDTEGMAYYAFTTFDAGVGAGPFMFRAGVDPGNVARTVKLALNELRRTRDGGITADEMENAILFLGGGVARQVETNGGLAAALLSQEIFGLGDDHYLRYESILRSLTLDDVNRALANHLHPDNYHLAVAGPETQ